MHEIAAMCYIKDDKQHILAIKFGEYQTNTVCLCTGHRIGVQSLEWRKLAVRHICVAVQSKSGCSSNLFLVMFGYTKQLTRAIRFGEFTFWPSLWWVHILAIRFGEFTFWPSGLVC